MSDDYTPSTDDVRDRWSLGHTKNGAHFTPEAFDRWIASVVTAAEKRGADKERERIERRINAALDDPNFPTFGDDYDRGAAYALGLAARLAREDS